ncbi:hypothetical protein Tco_0962956 [Tanacetum coccineum]
MALRSPSVKSRSEITSFFSKSSNPNNNEMDDDDERQVFVNNNKRKMNKTLDSDNNNKKIKNTDTPNYINNISDVFLNNADRFTAREQDKFKFLGK